MTLAEGSGKISHFDIILHGAIDYRSADWLGREWKEEDHKTLSEGKGWKILKALYCEKYELMKIQLEKGDHLKKYF